MKKSLGYLLLFVFMLCSVSFVYGNSNFKLDTGNRLVEDGKGIGFLALTSDKSKMPKVYTTDSTVASVYLKDPSDSRGFYFEVYGRKPGVATIGVELDGITRTFDVNVVGVTLQKTSFRLDTGNRVLNDGQGIGFLAVTSDKREVPKVYTTNSTVASVYLKDPSDSRGFYFEVYGRRPGNATIGVQLGGVTKTFDVRVKGNPADFRLDTGNRVLNDGQGIGFLALTSEKSETPKVYTTNSTIASVYLKNSNDPRGYYFEVYGRRPGNATIGVQLGGVTKTFDVRVKGNPADFRLDTGNRTIEDGKGIGFLALTSEKSETPKVYTTNSTVASVYLKNSNDPRGYYFEVYGRRAGNATIGVQLGGVTKTFNVQVTQSYKPQPQKETSKVFPSVKGAIRGVDLSYYNTVTDWRAVKNSGIEFAFIRSSGTGAETGRMYKDSKFDQLMQGAQSVGIKTGIYHYSQAINEAEARAEARYAINIARRYRLDYPVVLDMEFYHEGNFTGRNASISNEQRTKVALAFLDEVRKLGYQPMFYSYTSFMNNSINMKPIEARYPVWVAQYNDRVTYGGKYKAWQYTSSGTVPGINGRVDMNLWYK